MDYYKEICAHAAVRFEDLLDAREARNAHRCSLQEQWGCTLVCFTLNMPGEYKVFSLADRTFELGRRLILITLATAYGQVLTDEIRSNTGHAAFFGVRAGGYEVKKRLAAIEESHSLGRLFDIDVYSAQGEAVHRSELGLEQRRCLICGGPVWGCARSRSHSARELSYRAVRLMREYFDGALADEIAQRAVRALIIEAAVAPKPGLVDRFDSGAHKDMDIFTFINSACCLFPYFRSVSLAGINFEGEASELLDILRTQGIEAQEQMLAATDGVNTHKGAIFSLGILCASAGYMYRIGMSPDAETLFGLAAQVAGSAKNELSGTTGEHTHGEIVYARYGLAGVRGEAASGFASVHRWSLPEYRRLKAEAAGDDAAGVISLLHIMAHVEDTNVIYRSGMETLKTIQARVVAMLEGEEDKDRLLRFAAELNAEFTARGISPGGCADLLAVTIFADSLFDGTIEP